MKARAEETVERAIVVPSDAKPWKACSQDETRAILAYGYLKRRDDGLWLLTTDRYIACAIKVEGDAEEGYVSRRVMKLLANWRRVVQIESATWQATTTDGLRVFNVPALIAASRFPDFEALGMWEERPVVAAGESVRFDPLKTAQLMVALGYRHGGCEMRLSRPMRITSERYPDRIGLQMPVGPPRAS